MNNIKNHIKGNWKKIIYLTILFFIVLISQNIIKELIIFQNELDDFENELYDREKENIKLNVNNRMIEIENSLNKSQSVLETEIYDKISNLDFAISNTLSNFNSPTSNDILSIILSTTIVLSESDANYDYYLIDTSGNLYNYNELDVIVSENIYEEKDFFNRFYIKEMITNVINNEDEDVFVTYYISKEDDTDKKQYTSYVKRIEGTDYLIYTGAFFEDFTKAIEEELVNSFTTYYKDTDDYVYILDGSGNVIYHKNEEYIGQKYNDILDTVWTNALDYIVDYLEVSESGFVSYSFYENSTSGSVVKRTAYIEHLDEWDYIIGSSFNHNIYNSILDEYKTQSYTSSFIYNGAFVVVLILLAYTIFKYVSKNVNNSFRIFSEEETLYRKFADSVSEIILITDPSGTILYGNANSGVVFGRRKTDGISTNINQILGDEEGFSVLRGTDRDYFVKFRREDIVYDSKNCELYFITDVTDDVKAEKELQLLILNDELTKLGNRRKLTKDFNMIVNPYVRDGNTAYFVMLDLDNFKNVNDKYGHIYGDEVLRIIGGYLNRIANKNVFVYRVSGDEFSVIFINHSEHEVFKILHNLNQNISKHNWENDIEISYSGGVSTMKSTDKYRRLNDYVEQADKKLYSAKMSGKMKVN
ncbi:hypothetical protein CI105_02850 [Candidatus Izimaplasma bacterium ZiA1]|uniref:diguanylate cyclase n=1 Tax=Candidatus Izimoplasma sp. ZiA1 TaxID=2024899 RepID=UPI000BAA850F|nr:hypothetical protein CI105_02850 [Candidatus Izimaplasma bacterium ZiA1]